MEETGLMSLDGMVFGMPPSTYVSDDLMKNSMPTASIIPCEPKFTEGLSLFSLDSENGFKYYSKILNSVGFKLSRGIIKVAYLADNFPTDTFSNEYGETFLDNLSQAASSAMGDMSQMFGWNTIGDVKAGASKIVKMAPGGGKVTDFAAGLQDSFNTYTQGLDPNQKQMMEKLTKTAGQVATGARVDFPLVWKNSNFTPSYSMTIRLYNPNPSNQNSTKRYIVGPIAALLSLAVPKVTEDGNTYKWPLLCKIKSPGIYNLNAAYIQSISIVKGGDNQCIGFNQALAMCDVRIEFGSLYNSILAGDGADKLGDSRPTLGNYLEAIGGFKVSGDSELRNVPDKSVYALNDKRKFANSPTDKPTVSASPKSNESTDMDAFMARARNSKVTDELTKQSAFYVPTAV